MHDGITKYVCNAGGLEHGWREGTWMETSHNKAVLMLGQAHLMISEDMCSKEKARREKKRSFDRIGSGFTPFGIGGTQGH
jgi:hypothetical protein